MNAHALCATSSASVSGSAVGYPSTAIRWYHCASQASTYTEMPACGPNLDPDGENADARSSRAVVTSLAEM
jgi:hypothetical protein